VIEVELASGTTHGYITRRKYLVELLDDSITLSSTHAYIAIDPYLTEPLITDATIDELGIQVISFKRGLWRHLNDPIDKTRKKCRQSERSEKVFWNLVTILKLTNLKHSGDPRGLQVLQEGRDLSWEPLDEEEVSINWCEKNVEDIVKYSPLRCRPRALAPLQLNHVNTCTLCLEGMEVS
jgi:hypothetical protein